MSSAKARRTAQTLALVNLLKALPEQQFVDVLKGLGIEQPVEQRRPVRVCRVCGLVYPKCRARWEGDHDFEAPRPKQGATHAD